MPDLSALASFLDDDAFTTPPLPSKEHPDGKVYVVPSPDAATGLELTAMAQLAGVAATGGDVTSADLERFNADGDDETTYYRMVLGTAFDEMVDDGVSWLRIDKLTRYLFLRFAMSEEAAEVLLGEAPAPPNRAARRQASRSVTAKSTPSRASTSGTTSPRRKPAKA